MGWIIVTSISFIYNGAASLTIAALYTDIYFMIQQKLRTFVANFIFGDVPGEQHDLHSIDAFMQDNQVSNWSEIMIVPEF